MSNLTNDELMALTEHTMSMLNSWGLRAEEIKGLLDLPESVKPRHLSRYGKDTALPDEPQVLRRVEYLMKISEALRTSYPRNPHMRNQWMRNANHRMGGRAPLQIILDGGETGLVSVLARLDCTFAWDSSGSKS